MKVNISAYSHNIGALTLNHNLRVRIFFVKEHFLLNGLLDFLVVLMFGPIAWNKRVI